MQQQLSTDIPSESSLYNHTNEQLLSIGSADTLKRAMTVNKLNEMLGCIKNMKMYAKTIEKDLPDYLNTIGVDKRIEINKTEYNSDDLLQLAKQRLNNNHYILLNDLIDQDKVDLLNIKLKFFIKYFICQEIQ
jgi:hypothetical protein